MELIESERTFKASFEYDYDSDVMFNFTNENLETIVNSLNPKKEELILAVCGSGDQILALLESGAKVLAVDYNVEQLMYLNKRIEYLKKGNISSFLKVNEKNIPDDTYQNILNERNKYFLEKSNINKIIKNIDNLTVLKPLDIFQSPQFFQKRNLKFDLIYLSNAIDYDRHDQYLNYKIIDFFNELPKITKQDSKVYLTSRRFKEIIDMSKINTLYIDSISTSRANCEHTTFWKPIVYRIK